MTMHIKGINYDLWLMVKNGCNDPALAVGEVTLTKPEDTCNDKKKASSNAKDYVCALEKSEFTGISHC